MADKMKKVEPCDICGDIGIRNALRFCSNCKISSEHVYCRRTVTESDNYRCDECWRGRITSPECSRRFWKRQKVVRTGKVKCIPSEEAIKLTSSSKKCEFSMKTNKNLICSPLKIMGPNSECPRTPDYGKGLPPKPPVPSGTLPVKKQPVFQRHVTQISALPTEKKAVNSSRKELIEMVKAVETKDASTGKELCLPQEGPSLEKQLPYKTSPVMPAVQTEGASSGKKTGVLAEVSCASSAEIECLQPSSSGHQANVNLGQELSDEENRELGTVEHGPAINTSWKGHFEVVGCEFTSTRSVFEAHVAVKVHSKVLLFTSRMPKLLRFKLSRVSDVWRGFFEDDKPEEDDIGLYFFPAENERSTDNCFLLEFMDAQDVLLTSDVNGADLFVFSSKLLTPPGTQKWDDCYFLWGVFRRTEKLKDVQKLYEELPRVIDSPDCAQHDDDGVGDDYANIDEDDNCLDMDIDMIAGMDVGKVDIPIPRPSIAESSSSVVKPNIKEEPWTDCPPGFEERHR